jgi:hypothetical protein
MVSIIAARFDARPAVDEAVANLKAAGFAWRDGMSIDFDPLVAPVIAPREQPAAGQ